MNVLVTGGAGYIGSHAVRKLLDAGHRVVVCDDLSHGHHAAVDPRARFLDDDVGDCASVQAALRENQIEAVLHFAAFIEVGESVLQPARYYHNNTVNVLFLLDAMNAAGVRKLVFSSTAAVYGNPLRTPIDEDHPRNPINLYGRSKFMTELAIGDYSAAYGLGYAVLRYFNVAGAAPDGTLGEAHEPESHLIPRILSAAAGRGAGVSIFGTDYPTRDGTCVRDHVHVEDLVDAHLPALEQIVSARDGRTTSAANAASPSGRSSTPAVG
jgi:UDP-glucose 4-epimerase